VTDVLLQVLEHFFLIQLIDFVYLFNLFQLLPQLINLVALLDVQVGGFEEVGFVDVFNLGLGLFFLGPDPLNAQFIRVLLSSINNQLHLVNHDLLFGLFAQHVLFHFVLILLGCLLEPFIR
jgi:hypothetical protein